MSIPKFLNPGKRKLIPLKPEQPKVPGTNTNSNRIVVEAKKKAKEDVDVKHQTRKANRRISKLLADEATARMAARRERLLKGIQEHPVSLRQSDAYASSHGEIKDGNQVALDKAMSWYGLSNGLGLATNISDQWRATPSFANFVGRSTPEAMAMAGSLIANPVGTILGMGTGHLGSQAGGYIGELLGNREAGEIAGSLVGMPFGYKVGTTLHGTVPNYYRNYTLARAINQGVRETELPITRRTISVNRSNNSVLLQPDLVYTLYNEFGEPIGLTNVGGAVFGSGDKSHRMVDGVMSLRNAHKVSEDTYNAAVQDILEGGGKGLESGWSLMSPQKTLAVTKKFPHEVIGLEFGNPVRLLTGTTNRPIPIRVKGNHYQEVKPLYEITYNETTGDFERIPIEKVVNTEGLYNHPGAFLRNTVRETGGITVNGEGVLRRPYIAPQPERISVTTEDPLMAPATKKGPISYGYDRKSVASKATEEFTDEVRRPLINRRANEDNTLADALVQTMSGTSETRFGTGNRTLTEPGPHEVVTGTYLDLTEQPVVRGTGLLGTKPVSVSSVEGSYRSSGNFGNMSSVTDSMLGGGKYGFRNWADLENYVSGLNLNKLLFEYITDLINRTKSFEDGLQLGPETTNGIIPKALRDNTALYLQYLADLAELSDWLMGNLNFGAKNQKVVFPAPKAQQIIIGKSENPGFATRTANIGIPLRSINGDFNYYKSTKLNERLWPNGMIPEEKISYYNSLSPTDKTRLLIQKDNPQIMFPLHFRGTGPNPFPGMTTMQVRGIRPALKKGGRIKISVK